jgi:hypothetical protein
MLGRKLAAPFFWRLARQRRHLLAHTFPQINTLF